MGFIMAAIAKEYKTQLGLLLAKGHARFGRVAPRRPYRDDESGEGAASLTIETHPLLAKLPIGAASDLTAITTDNSETLEEAVKREGELTEALRNQPALQAQLSQRRSYIPKPTPY
jgi:hypothetical protein